jgi:diguanylate cyclase (GGDEF)-like protein
VIRIALSVLALLFASSSFGLAPQCSANDSVQLSGAKMADVICDGVKKKVIEPASNNWFGMCAAGGGDGFVSSWDDLKAFGKFVGVTIPAYQWKLEKFVVIKEFNLAKQVYTLARGKDPIAEIDRIAHHDAISARDSLKSLYGRWQLAKEMTNAFVTDMAHSADLVGSSMACLPWTWKVQYICEFVQQMVVGLAGADVGMTAANKSATIAKAIARFENETKMIDGMKGISLSDRMKAASDALKSSSDLKVFMRTPGANVLVRKDAITGADRYFLEQFETIKGQKIRELTEVVRDVKTGAFDSNYPAGAKLARLVAANSKGKFLIFTDVMDLGKTNYFKAGTQAGDKYLEHSAAALRSNLRQGDFIFKNGGDELVVVLDTTDPTAVVKFQNRVHETMKNDKDLQALFKADRVEKAKAVSRAEVPKGETVADLQDAARIRPGVAMGASRIEAGSGDEAWSGALRRSEAQAALAKAQTKVNRGADIKKYNQAAVPTTSRPHFDAEIPVYDPIE